MLGVGVVDLDGGVVGQIVVITAAGGTLGQESAGPRRKPLGTAGRRADGVRLRRSHRDTGKKRQVFVDVGLVERDAVVDDALINGIEIEQIQRVRAALVACDGQLVQTGAVGLGRPARRDRPYPFFRPGVGGQPRVGQLILDAVLEGLVEQAEVIPQADTVAGQVQRGEESKGKQAARRPSPPLPRLGSGSTSSISDRFFPAAASAARVSSYSPKLIRLLDSSLPDQKLGADIVELAARDGTDAGGALFADDVQQGQIDFLVGAGGQGACWFWLPSQQSYS